MYSEGDIMRNVELVDPTSGRLSQLIRKVRNLVVRSTAAPDIILEDHVILTALLKVCMHVMYVCLHLGVNYRVQHF